MPGLLGREDPQPGAGLVGKKGVLWWEIHRLLRLKLQRRPVKLPLPRERRPAPQVADRPARPGLRGDARLARRPRLRGRVARRQCGRLRLPPEATTRLHHRAARPLASGSPNDQLIDVGRARASAACTRIDEPFDWTPVALDRDIRRSATSSASAPRKTPFGNAGVMRIRPSAWTRPSGRPTSSRRTTARVRCSATSSSRPRMSRSSSSSPMTSLRKWQFLKGAKSEQRISTRDRARNTPTTRGRSPSRTRPTGPSRTILTGEGGATPSRFKHLIQTEDGRYRRLTPRELERLNGFPDDWTAGHVRRPARLHDGQRPRRRTRRAHRRRADRRGRSPTQPCTVPPSRTAPRSGPRRAGLQLPNPPPTQSGRPQRHAGQPSARHGTRADASTGASRRRVSAAIG